MVSTLLSPKPYMFLSQIHVTAGEKSPDVNILLSNILHLVVNVFNGDLLLMSKAQDPLKH